MPLTYEQLRDEALTLPIDQRLVLADALYGSADNDDPEAFGEFPLHPDWRAELDRRYEEIQSGAVKAIPAETIKKMLAARVKAL